MIEYVKIVLGKYADFEGRARRSEFWYWQLFSTIVSAALALMGVLLGIGFLDSIWTLAVIVPSIAVAVRRMHDIGKSGWYGLIPFYNIILACTNGDVGSNEYGPDPKGGTGYATDDTLLDR
jgi:uncharacterized membrane protein YhaH (DUF805 family)